MCKVVVIVALVGVIAVASLAIGIAFADPNPPASPPRYSIKGGLMGASPQQKLLEVAERVVVS